MKTFLHTFASFLEEKNGHELGSSCIVFPNRRAGLFFKKHYASISNRAGWLPEIITINDFMSSLSGLQVVDPLEASFETYRCFKKITGFQESYDEFYSWGEMMLSDFDDIDKYLVDASQLFRNIVDLKEIDTAFDYLDENQKRLIQRFWKTFEAGKQSEQKESFLQMWKVLFPVYQMLKNNLVGRELGYEGMIYRKVAEERISNPDFTIPWTRIFIAGFNALSKSEEMVFKYLRDTKQGSFYWDYDSSYIHDPLHEAGRFLRRNIKSFPQDPEFDRMVQNLPDSKKVSIISLPSDVLQAKELNNLPELLNKDKSRTVPADFTDTAIILGDESLLSSVLTSLPGNIEKLNITMGYPVSQTPVFSFLESVMRMQLNLQKSRNSGKYYYRDVLSILNHQYVKSFYTDETDKLVAQIHKENKIYLNKTDFEEDSLFRVLFTRQDNLDNMVDYLLDIFETISSALLPEQESSRLEKEYIYLIRTRLIKLKNLFEDMSGELTLESFIRLFRKVLNDFRIPFEGEPLQGIQIMGILESRLLDFKNLVFLSMNEGIMPATSVGFSYIPSNLRLAFNMPVKEDKDAIYAYYFYRLLNRAEQITIMYNNQAEGMKSGEPSRYIHQIEYLTDWDIWKKTRSFRVKDKEAVGIQIKKTGEVLTILQKFVDEEDVKYLSPSALTTFMDCSLRFYFSYIAGIKEEDEASEEIDASAFGSLFHKTLELIYQDFSGTEITEKIIDSSLEAENIRKQLDQSFREEFLRTNDSSVKVQPEGRNIIIYEVIKKLVIQTLQIDRKVTPFLLKDTEQQIEDAILSVKGIGKVRLGGKIDRLDIRESGLHVIDYKTGNVSLNFPGMEGLFNRDTWPEKENLKGIFQTFMYSWLYHNKNRDKTYITPVIYPAREFYKEDFSIYLTDKIKKETVWNFLDYAEEFENGLRNLVEEIYNPAVLFQQTEDEKRCANCPYKEICHRS